MRLPSTGRRGWCMRWRRSWSDGDGGHSEGRQGCRDRLLILAASQRDFLGHISGSPKFISNHKPAGAGQLDLKPGIKHGGACSGYYYSWLALAVCVTLAGGCGKKHSETALPPPSAATFDPARDAAPQPTDLPPNPQMQVIAAGQDTDAILAQLSAELGRYVRYTHAPPKNFEEFATKDPISYPPPPAGKKYMISAGKVVLK